METIKIRSIPVDELIIREDYRDLVHRHHDKEYESIKNIMGSNGFDPAQPIVANPDLVVLDGHRRLQIAQELGLDRVWVMILEFANPLKEQEYILTVNLNRSLATRKLNMAVRAEMVIKLQEIEKKQRRG